MSLQKNIAERLGVSQGIVSHILSGRRKVRTELHKQIVREAKRIGYVRNHSAVSLRTGRMNTWGIIMPKFSFMADFNRQIVEGICDVAAENGKTISVMSMEAGKALGQTYMSYVRENRFDGIFLFYQGDQAEEYIAHFEELKSLGLATVVVNCPLYDSRTHHVYSDSQAGIYKSVKHLIEVHGRRKIAYLNRVRNSWMMEERYKGYVQALREAGIELDPDLVWDLHSSGSYEKDAEIAINELLARGVVFDAICAPMDYIAIPALAVLSDHGLRVPEDVSVTGFDDYHLCTGVRPRLTTVRCNGLEMGRKASEMMLDVLDNPDDQSIRKHVVPTELIIRESCGCRLS